MQSSESSRFFLSFETDADYDRAREVFLKADYSVPGIQKRLGLEGTVFLPNSEGLLTRRTVGGDPLDVLLRLFLGGHNVAIKDVREALKPMDLETWVRAGLLEVREGFASARIKLLPSADWVVAFDRQKRGHAHFQDMVLGISNATLTLLNLTARRQVRQTLDMGTGCGIQAFFASRHSERVFAVDQNPRAIEYAKFNTRLNGIGNVECREGDRFDPVEGLRFDFVICNAPFVISPSSGYISLDGGMKGDDFCRSVARQVIPRLTEGGLCQMLCNWAHFADRDWQQNLASWFEGTGCDVWVIRSRRDSAANYARLWIREIYGEDSPEFESKYHEWMDYYERENIEGMSMGMVNLRRVGNGPTRIRIDDAPEMVEASGEDIIHLLELRDFLQTVQDDDRLLEAFLATSPELRLEHHSRRGDAGGWQVASSRLFLVRGFVSSVNTDALLPEVLSRCDGRRTVRAALEEASAALRVDLTSRVPDCLNVIRRCVELGFLAPSSIA